MTYPLSSDSDFNFQLLEILSFAPYEGSDISDVIVAANQIAPVLFCHLAVYHRRGKYDPLPDVSISLLDERHTGSHTREKVSVLNRRMERRHFILTLLGCSNNVDY